MCSDHSPHARSLVPSEAEIDTHDLILRADGKSVLSKLALVGRLIWRI